MLPLDTVGLRNEQFSALEIQFIRRHLKDAEAEIVHIDERRRQLTDNIRRYTIAIAPHNRLPEDVIQHIFAFFIQNCAIHFPFKKDERPSQVVLSHVCSTWRRIALHMKRLWSHITITPHEHNRFFFLRPFCETWSPRILTHMTLDLASFYLELSGPDRRKSFLDPFLHFQFEEVEFIINGEQLEYLCRVSDDTSLKVEKVALAIEFASSRILLPNFLSRPLHSFKIFPYDENNVLDLERVFLPWDQLRCLDFGGIESELSSLIGILQQCTFLEVCSLKLCLADSGGMLTEQVTLPVLRKLTIHVGSAAKDLCALSHFLLPSLKILEIQGGEWTYDIHEIFRKQLNIHQLHELDIAHVTYSPTVSYILKEAPSLRRLSLSPHAIFDEEILRGLGNGELGQHLELLQLYDHCCNVDAIHKMVETRQETRKFIPGIASVFHVQFTCNIAGQNRFLVVSNDMRIELCYTN